MDAGGRLAFLYEDLRRRLEDHPDPALWISRLPWNAVQSRLIALEQAWSGTPDAAAKFPLYGVPFAVKDNIDVEGLETTAACPAFAFRAAATATSVARLLDAGAVLIGKANMDQFAWWGRARLTERCATRSLRITCREGRVPARPSPSPPAWSASPWAPIPPALVAFPRGSITW
jgi:hypothetical protein